MLGQAEARGARGDAVGPAGGAAVAAGPMDGAAAGAAGPMSGAAGAAGAAATGPAASEREAASAVGPTAGRGGLPLAIEARGLVKQFGNRRGLDGVDLALPQGAFLSIFGPNGAGKTTLLRELALLARPTRGSLSMLGVDALEEPERLRGRIGLISHRSMLYGDLTAYENLAFFASLYGIEGAAARERIEELLRLVELDHRRNDCARTFSRGMQQRLSIARALVNDPAIVLLDEPYSGLDPHAAELFDQLIGRVREGRTFVMVSHDLDKGFDLCTHALVLARGRVVVCADKTQIDRAAFRDLYLATVGLGVA